jgi:hypothetical protein
VGTLPGRRHRHTGVWDADASYTNRGLLAAVDDVLLLAEEDSFPLHPAASPARRLLDSTVGTAASRMVEEFLRVTPPSTVCHWPVASSSVSLLVFPISGERISSSTSGEVVDASDGGTAGAGGGPARA